MKFHFFQRLSAWALLVLFLGAFSAREAHRLFGHCHAEKMTCHDARSGESHLHDERFQNDGCDLCGFVVSAAQLPDFQEFSLVFERPFFVKISSEIHFWSASPDGFIALRGPPTA